MPTTFSATNLPKRATMWHDESTVLVGNALTRAVDTNQRYNTYSYQSAPAINDTFTQSFFLRAGDYYLLAIGIKFTDRGIVTWTIDTTVIGTWDLYAAAAAYNSLFTSSLFTLVGDGYHVLTGKVASKNASSTNYTAPITKIWLQAAND